MYRHTHPFAKLPPRPINRREEKRGRASLAGAAFVPKEEEESLLVVAKPGCADLAPILAVSPFYTQTRGLGTCKERIGDPFDEGTYVRSSPSKK